jgi:RNA recognition motif-containing protein
MKLLIRNLARSTTEAEVRALFEAYGKVQSCTLVMDKKSSQSKGFGFIEMPKPGEAKAAIKNLNGKEIADNKIRVKKAEEKSELDKDEVSSNVSTEAKKNERVKSKEKEKAKPGFQGWKSKGR